MSELIRETEVDGVPTLIAPTLGPMHAGLVFRVGRADETLAGSGITHLLEHLALYRHGLADYHFNGATGSTVTYFHLHGSGEDIVAFLAAVCDSLRDLPVERVSTEKEILRTEWSSRTAGVNEQMPLWRYGARDYGLLSYPEWGLGRLTADDLRQWAGTWFTRGNAALWIAGDDVPAGLRLRLPDGERRPLPAPSSALPVTPAYFASGQKAVVFDTVVRRRVAAATFSGVLEREMYRSLRQEGGYSYTATAAYDPRGDGYAVVTAFADALPDKRGAALGGFVDVLARLKVGRIAQADVDAVRTKAAEQLRHPDAAAARLPAHAVNLVSGFPNDTLDQLRDELVAVTVADVHEVAVEAMGSALMMVPDGHRADWAGFTAAPVYSTEAVSGTPYRSREHDDVSLVVGTDGASVVTSDGAVTVRYDRCAAALTWPDGARQLIGDDGIVVRVEPTLYEVEPAALAHLDASLPPAATVAMPARPPEAIPQPPAPAPTPARVTPKTELETAIVVLFTLFSVLAAGLGVLGTIGTFAHRSASGGWGLVAVVWVFAVVLALPAVFIVRRRRRS